VRVLITGATGLLGGRLLPAWRQSGMDVVAVGHAAAADAAVDLTDQKATWRLLEERRPEVVVNLVALSNVDACEQDPQRAYLLNVRTAQNLAGWLAKRPGAALVHISTDHVYDGPGAHAEPDVTLLNIYAYSKFAAELAVLAVGGTALRVNFFGRSLTAGRMSFSDAIIQGLSAGQPMGFFTDVFFSPLSLDTLAAMIARVVADPAPGVFNLGAASGLSKRDFAWRVAQRMGLTLAGAREITLAQAGLRARRPTGMVMAVGKFEKRYGVTLPSLEAEMESATL